MKKYIILILICIANLNTMNGQNDYKEEWKKVETFDQQGLPKSALEVVETIFKKSKSENNDNQLIKALFHKAKYLLTLEENAQLTIINEFKSEINQSQFPKRNILENILANLYWQYFQQNRWKFYNRTQTSEKIDKEDFRTWDLETLFTEIHLHYQKSIQNGVLAQQTDLKKFDDILITHENSKKYRPTLYDFLLHNALTFYKSSETGITKPAYAFTINNPDFLKEYNTFSALEIKPKDSLSLQGNALKLYQNLIKFHSRDTDPTALTEVNIERLQFVYENAIFGDKQNILLDALNAEKEKIKDHSSSALYYFEIANIYKQQAASYIPNDNEVHRWRLKKAIEICNDAIQKFPNSRGANKCILLKDQILHPEISIKTEKYLPINTPGRLLISYKNLDKLYLRALKVNKKQLKSLNRLYRTDEQIKFLNSLKVIKTWESKIKNEKDFQTHTTEVLLPNMEKGAYLVVATVSEGLSPESLFSYGDVQISNLALIENRTSEKTIFQVIDRNTGSPIANAKVHLKTDSARGYRNKLDKMLSTDRNGQCSLALNNYYYDVTITVSHENDSAYFEGYYLNQSYRTDDNENQIRYNTFLFTDRSIYRPGQTVYFKGIMMSSSGKEDFKVLPDKSTFVRLMDVNGQEVKMLTFKTNEYGSFSGEFILPSSGLTGIYTLQTDNYQSTSISVEEYKRPKFETKFNPVTETYRINDNVKLTGTANAYAGSNITDAKVVYRVHRKVQYPRWCYWYPRYTAEPQEITHGETKTDEKGEYFIEFVAQPDPSVSKENLPIFNYEVIADVTDINGETRSTTTIVNVGYHAMTAAISVLDKIDKTQKDNSFSVTTLNLNNEFIEATGTLKIHKLQAPSKPMRLRPWKAPDYKGFEKEEFTKLFPHDAYDNESDYRTWKKGKLVLDASFNTSASKNQEIGNQKISFGNIKKWESGKYVIQLDTKDKFGQDVKDIQYITVFSQDDKTISDQQLFEVTTNQKTYKIGEEAIIKLSSASEDITITVDIEKNQKIIETRLVKLSKNSKTIKIPVTKQDLGGFAISYSFANYNGYQNGTIPISVPYAPSELSIETKTFRDKLQPGEQETWSFIIKGPKGDKVSAELLASMYDASLDQFKPHQWYFNPINRPVYYPQSKRQATRSFVLNAFKLNNHSTPGYYYSSQVYDQLNWFGLYFGQQYLERSKRESLMFESAPAPMMQKSMAVSGVAEDAEMEESVAADQADNASEKKAKDNDQSIEENKKDVSLEGVKIRKNLQETAFFFPQLSTDERGNVSFNFTAPEALTKWKLQLLAHTKELNTTTTTLETVTQKELMILANPPRFLREGDRIVLSTKISNLTNKVLSGVVELQLFDALTNKTIDTHLQNTNARQTFEVKTKGNTNVSWELQIPDDVQTVQYKIIAKAGDFADGEQNVLPVLSNRMLVTETLPMWIKSNQTKSFTLDKLKNSSSNTLKHHKLTLEMTSNPAWYAVQALPYLMEYPYECSEQTFSRYYANALASHIANSTPRIQEVFNQWKSTDALLSNLEKNQELKSLIIQETPWLRDAQSETEQKKRIALLFDLNKMNNELQSALNKLKQMQYGSGGFPWFKGGHENRFITQHIATGFGHLKKLGVTQFDNGTLSMLQNAIKYLDKEFIKEYDDLKRYCKKNKIDINKNHLSYTQIHYLYMRSFFGDIKRPKNTNEAWNYYLGQSKKYWLKQNLYAQGMLALILERNDSHESAVKIIRSLDERSISSEELGMYWKSNIASWYWHQAPIETQSLMIEVFSEIEKEPKRTEIVDNLKIWLLKNKQTNRWQTTKATSDAVYALLLQGSDWLSVTDMVEITLGDQKIDPNIMDDIKVEAGTGYFKTSWNGSEVKPNMATTKITKKGKGIAWGALYWQYFENLDKITATKTPLSLSKKLFIKKNTDTGEEITEITDATNLQLGDLVRVRVELRSDRAMEFVHMKDMRASGLEPINVISQYKWQDGLGYYESTKDAATNFFFDYLPKGVYVFEYDLRVNNKGDFSNGITTIQSMYAPEFSSHSEGVRIIIN
ncbi:MG2 domain-containing protein [Aquimarina gracilis]|uniref:MG2 domain-containing protein n=2 Tax=Aquimarina gracilis TaxID=874422 RepID=A0ABU5ZS78_9FLAO|nr:MG2 domain-containing protein [Aquimarina gracilis]MEB3344907.1 MG2 domain-containing protein [Aquimarina gracilis]